MSTSQVCLWAKSVFSQSVRQAGRQQLGKLIFDRLDKYNVVFAFAAAFPRARDLETGTRPGAVVAHFLDRK